MEQTLDVSNAVAVELAGISDGVLDALKERLSCTVRLRGNQLTLEGDEQHVADARAVIDELVELVEGGHQIGSYTVYAVLGTLEAGQDVREVIDACRKITGHPIPAVVTGRRAGDPPELVADSRLARQLLDWTPQYTTIESIVETAWRWHKAHPRGYKI